MSNLKNNVPDLALCRLIPQGLFPASALVWRVPNSSFPLEDEYYEVHERDKCESWMKDKQIPAPLLDEILEVINIREPKEQTCILKKFGKWACKQDVCCVVEERAIRPANAAILMFLRLQGFKIGRAPLFSVDVTITDNKQGEEDEQN